VFVGNQDSVKMVERIFDGGKPCQRFAFAEAGIYKEASALGFEQRQVARTSGRQNGYAQADRFPPAAPDTPDSWRTKSGSRNHMPNVVRQQV
jgi:hypothetical protein